MSENEPSRLDRTMNLLALAALRGIGQKEQIELLDRAGFGRSEIAELLGSTPNAIGVRLNEIKKSKGRIQKKQKIGRTTHG